MKKHKISLRDPEFDDFYCFEFVWVPAWHEWLTGAGHWVIYSLARPSTGSAFSESSVAPNGEIYLPPNEPRPVTLDDAKRLAGMFTLACSLAARNVPQESIGEYLAKRQKERQAAN